MTVNDGYDPVLIAAILNSAITILTLELKGTDRRLGALDLNANYLKTLPLLNPDLIDDVQKNEIVAAFEPLRHRPVKTIFDEIQAPDRRNFDETVFLCYGINVDLLDTIYGLISESVQNRISLAER